MFMILMALAFVLIVFGPAAVALIQRSRSRDRDLAAPAGRRYSRELLAPQDGMAHSQTNQSM